MNEWQLYKRNGLEFFSIDSWLKAGVNMAFSTRNGGISTGVYDSCNLGLHVGDDAEKVLANRRSVLQLFQAELGQAVCCEQVHGNLITKVDARYQGQGAYRLDESITACDGMITNSKGVYLLTFYADCLPIYFFDPVHRAVGMAHSGWKGTMARIAVQTIEAMQKEYDSRSEDLHVAIGPGIGVDCFEISSDLADKVGLAFPGYHDIIYPKPANGLFWDLPETNRQMLVEQGVDPQHISVCGFCTACHPEILFSYRRDNGKTGRMGALIALEY